VVVDESDMAFDRESELGKMSDSEVEAVFKHIPQKGESFAKEAKLEYNNLNDKKNILSLSFGLSDLMDDSTVVLDNEKPDLKKCVEALSHIHSTNLSGLENLLYLARDIVREFDMVRGLTVLN
jgi:hypothetical protein